MAQLSDSYKFIDKAHIFKFKAELEESMDGDNDLENSQSNASEEFYEENEQKEKCGATLSEGSSDSDQEQFKFAPAKREQAPSVSFKAQLIANEDSNHSSSEEKMPLQKNCASLGTKQQNQREITLIKKIISQQSSDSEQHLLQKPTCNYAVSISKAPVVKAVGIANASIPKAVSIAKAPISTAQTQSMAFKKNNDISSEEPQPRSHFFVSKRDCIESIDTNQEQLQNPNSFAVAIPQIDIENEEIKCEFDVTKSVCFAQVHQQCDDQPDSLEEEPLQGLINYRFTTISSNSFVGTGALYKNKQIKEFEDYQQQRFQISFSLFQKVISQFNIFLKFGISLNDIYLSQNMEFFADINPLERDYNINSGESPILSTNSNKQALELLIQKIKNLIDEVNQSSNDLDLKVIFSSIQKLFTINQKLMKVDFKVSQNELEKFDFYSEEAYFSKLCDIVQFFKENNNFHEIYLGKIVYENKFDQLRNMHTYKEKNINKALKKLNEKERTEIKKLTKKLLEISNQKNKSLNFQQQFDYKPICLIIKYKTLIKVSCYNFQIQVMLMQQLKVYCKTNQIQFVQMITTIKLLIQLQEIKYPQKHFNQNQVFVKKWKTK
ncbi:hypothetical protein ABPG72_002635 [Tetrahymena utriculariae]